MVTESRIRVIIADDHARVRGQIREALEAGGCEICGEAATADEAIQLALEHHPDVALLDINMPGNGIHAAGRISRDLPETAIIMLTQSKEDDDLFDSLRAGASGYLLKNTDPATLPDALRSVLAGEAPLSPSLVSRILQEFRGPNRRHVKRSSAAAKLSAREWDVMELLGQGNSTEQVAKRLFVSSTTVRVHVSSVLRKLAVADRHAAFELLRDE
jgi:DNA-binding NarL/FixJ family response regulator